MLLIKPFSHKSLGVTSDNQLTMEAHISAICCSAHCHPRNIGRICSHITDSADVQLVHALVTSRLDYCNLLLLGIPNNKLKRLQQIPNIAARIVSRT